MTQYIKLYPLLTAICLGTFWAIWPIAARKSGLSRDWINIATIFIPALVIIVMTVSNRISIATIFILALVIITMTIFNRISIEKIPTTESALWILLCTISCTLGFFIMREFLTIKELEIATYLPIAQTLTPMFVVIFAILMLGEPLTTRKILGLLLGCAGIYFIKT